jgi:pyruvate ferredoxin oxidoreductase alpha subunit
MSKGHIYDRKGKDRLGINRPYRKKMMMTGNYAAAYGAKLARAEVIPVYPITPQTQIMEKLIDFINAGQLHARFVPVESEHSALSVAIGAQATGARTFTASSSQGVAYMHENFFVASGLRLPIVMAIVNRGLAMPITIHPDQTDSLSGRDSGWIQYYASDAQEVLDLLIQAYKVDEDPRVLLPAVVCFEGFIVSHFTEVVEIPPEEEVDKFLPAYEGRHVRLDPEKPMHIGILVNEQYYTEYRYQQKVAMDQAKTVIKEVASEYRSRFGRGHGLVESYRIEDAEILVVTMGALSGPTRLAIDSLRKKGIPIGMVRLIIFRPFPREEIVRYAQSVHTVIVLDRNVSLGSTGIVYLEVASSLCNLAPSPKVFDVILGLGGRDVSLQDIEMSISGFTRGSKEALREPVQWLGVRGKE